MRDKDRTVARRGMRNGAGLKFAIVVARFNDFVTTRLEAGAVEALLSAGVSRQNISIIRVPGAFEIPFAAQQAARRGRFAAVVCLGCLIRGATAHFEYIAAAASQGIVAASLTTGVPMTFGVLTTNSKEEALERAVPGPLNKGWEAAMATVDMATLEVTGAAAATRRGAAVARQRTGRAAPARKK
jgi:6,7-dimethyl-8-ribityllumazine synthase